MRGHFLKSKNAALNLSKGRRSFHCNNGICWAVKTEVQNLRLPSLFRQLNSSQLNVINRGIGINPVAGSDVLGCFPRNYLKNQDTAILTYERRIFDLHQFL